MTVELTQLIIPAVLATVTGMGLSFWIYKQTIEKWYRGEKKTSRKANVLYWTGLVSCIFMSVGAMQIANEIFYVAFNESKIKIDKIVGGFYIAIILPLLIFGSSFIVAKLARSNKEKVSTESVNEVDYETAYIELKTNTQREGLWAMCLANCNGDENKAKAEYINKRVAEISNNRPVVQNKNTTKSEEYQNKNGQLVLRVISVMVLMGVAYFAWRSYSHIHTTDNEVVEVTKSVLPEKITGISKASDKTIEIKNCETCRKDGCKKTVTHSIKIKIDELRIISYQEKDGELIIKQKPDKNESCTIVRTDGFAFTCISKTDYTGGFSESNTSSYDGKERYTSLNRFHNLNIEEIISRTTCEAIIK